MEDNNESSRRNFVHQLEKYTLAEKQKIGKCVEMFKERIRCSRGIFEGKDLIRCQTQKVYTRGIGNLYYTFIAT